MKKRKLSFRTFDIRHTAPLERQARESINQLALLTRIDRAQIALRRHRECSPRFAAAGRLVVPGPDFLAVAQDQTAAAALMKLLETLRAQVLTRRTRRDNKLKTRRQLRRSPAGLAKRRQRWQRGRAIHQKGVGEQSPKRKDRDI